MSDLTEAKIQLEKASYYYGESNSELEHVQAHSKRLGEIIQGIADLLPLLGEDWSESAEVSQQNIGRADSIASNMQNALHLLEPMPEKFIASLGPHLRDALEGACVIEEATEHIRVTTSMVPPHEFSQLSGQFTDSAANIERTAFLNSETQQHFADVSTACTEYAQHL